jgi:hypothetical protein
VRRGVLVTPGGYIGDDMVVHLPVFRDSAPAVARSFVQIATLSRENLDAVLATNSYPNAVRAVREVAVALALKRAVLLIAARLRRSGHAVTVSGTLGTTRSKHAARHAELLSAGPMRELLAKAAVSAAAVAGNKARCATAASSSEIAASSAVQLVVDACGARLEAALQSTLEAITRDQLGRGGRRRRNVCQTSQSAPAAATLAIEPGQGLPADHQIAALLEA